MTLSGSFSTVFDLHERLLMKCADIDRPTAAPPVADLAAFVKKTSFEWSPTAVELFLPTALLTDAYAPDGKFAIAITPAQGNPRVTAFGPAAVSERTPRGVLYRFPVERGTAPLVYRPGETLTAELSVKAGTATYKLKWAAGGTATYQFDRLTREPELEPTAGGVAFPSRSLIAFGCTPGSLMVAALHAHRPGPSPRLGR